MANFRGFAARTPAIRGCAWLVATLALAFAFTATAAEPDEAALREIVRGAVTGHVIPAAAAFAAEAKRLVAATATECHPDGTPSPKLRQTFRDTTTAWGKLSVARFGPLTDDSRLDKLAFWPDPRGIVRRQTAQIAAALPAADAGAEAAVRWLGTQSAAVQGLPAFDAVAFADDDGRDCRLAQAIAGNIERLASAVRDGFKAIDRLALLTPAANAQLYRSYQDSAAEVIRAIATQTEVLRTTMMLAPLGAGTAEIKPTRLFLRTAPATKSFLLGALDGLQGLLQAMKLEPLLASDPRGLGERARRELQEARTRVEALPEDLATHLAETETWSQMASAARALERFNRVVNAGIAPALGVRTGFNALDGD